MDYNILVAEAEEDRLRRIPLTALYEALKRVKDGRKRRGCRYSLALILTLLLLARLAGETDIRAAAHWIKLRKKWIMEHLHLCRASVPCLGTYLYALGRVNAQDLLSVVAGCVTRWEAQERWEHEPSRLARQGGKQEKQHVAVDGKTMRGTVGHQSANQPSVHVLSVYEVTSGLVLAQRRVLAKENEISAVQELLDPLYVKDRVWTADAMHTQKRACQRIDQFGGKYLFFFKDTHPTAQEDLALFFQDPDADQSSWGIFAETEKGHGRLTTRLLRTTTEMNAWFAEEWAGVEQTFQLTRTVKRTQRKMVEQTEPEEQGSRKAQEKKKDGARSAKQRRSTRKTKRVRIVEETSQQVVYGFTNLTPAQASPQAIASLLRDHWAIENRLHWRRDVTLGEDASQLRTAGKPEVLAALNNVVLALMDWLGVRNVPEQMRIFSACPHHALQLLLGPLTFE
ncbi:MAG TPA: ISAs1 family transposase [Ktedonobacteraceae bacterium]|nr:ISAs1 family transposase [Ktedonobacteraceae bacterium]